MKIITICGSLKAKVEIIKVALKLSIDRNIVLTPIFPYNDEDINLTKEEVQKLDKIHKQKIKISDCIVVVNVNNYIGKSTASEIEYAKPLNKKIIYYQDIKKTSYIK